MIIYIGAGRAIKTLTQSVVDAAAVGDTIAFDAEPMILGPRSVQIRKALHLWSPSGATRLLFDGTAFGGTDNGAAAISVSTGGAVFRGMRFVTQSAWAISLNNPQSLTTIAQCAFDGSAGIMVDGCNGLMVQGCHFGLMEQYGVMTRKHVSGAKCRSMTFDSNTCVGSVYQHWLRVYAGETVTVSNSTLHNEWDSPARITYAKAHGLDPAKLKNGAILNIRQANNLTLNNLTLFGVVGIGPNVDAPSEDQFRVNDPVLSNVNISGYFLDLWPGVVGLNMSGGQIHGGRTGSCISAHPAVANRPAPTGTIHGVAGFYPSPGKFISGANPALVLSGDTLNGQAA